MTQAEKKLKILLATGIFPPDIGGPARFADALFNVLPEYGCEVKVLTYGNRKSDVGNRMSEISCVNRKQNLLMRYGRYFLKVWNLSKRADIIYAFDLISVGLPCAIVKLFRPKVKLIVRLGGDHLYETALQRGWYRGTMKNYYNEKFFNLRERFIYMINQFVIKRCDMIIFNSQFLRELYINKRGVKSEKTEIIKNIRPEFNLNIEVLGDTEEVKILYIGRLSAVRNLIGLIKAYRLMRQDLKSRARLEFVGEGPEKKRLVSYIKKYDLGNRVKLLPKLSHAKALEKMAESDVIVIPSYTECNANTVAEASKFNKILVVTKESDLYYSGAVNEGVVYINPLKVEDIREKLESVIEHALARELGVYDGMRIIEKTTWEIEKVMEKHLEIFREV